MSSNRSASLGPPSAAGPTRRTQALSKRAVTRLLIAAALMHLRRDVVGMGDTQCALRVLDIIDRLNPGARERLRSLVDWVEAYDREEQSVDGPKGPARPHLRR